MEHSDLRIRVHRCASVVKSLFCICWIGLVFRLQAASLTLSWRSLPPLPDRIGFAAPFAGISGRALLVAGGANFPGAMPWEGGQKLWYDSIYVLPKPDAEWLAGFKLPRPLAYGVSVSTPEGVLCAGGADARQ